MGTKTGLQVQEMSYDDWNTFAVKAERLSHSKNPRKTIEWALGLGVEKLSHHTHFALAEVDDLFDAPGSQSGVDRLYAVLVLFKAIGWAAGVEALGPYLRLYLAKQQRVTLA